MNAYLAAGLQGILVLFTSWAAAIILGVIFYGNIGEANATALFAMSIIAPIFAVGLGAFLLFEFFSSGNE